MPTWCPFRLQFYFNGHNRLATALDKASIEYELVDNAFVAIADSEAAQRLADSLDARELHHVLDRAACTYCPVIKGLGIEYHFSLMQVEYSTDIIFRNRVALQPLYEQLVRTAIHSVKPEQVATFLGRRLTANVSAEIGNDFNTRILGTRIRHHMGPIQVSGVRCQVSGISPPRPFGPSFELKKRSFLGARGRKRIGSSIPR